MSPPPPRLRALWPIDRECRQDLIAAAAVAAVALALRLVHLAQARAVPTFLYPLGDARAYLAWADSIAGGDWLSRGQGVFYQAPLYPYLLAAVIALAGPGLGAIRLVQAGLGSLACGLTAVAGRAWFGRPAGIAAGLLLALYPPAIFFDGLIQKAGLELVLAALLLAILTPATRTLPAWLAAGVTLALLALVLVSAGSVALFYVLARYRVLLLPALALLAGAALCELPNLVRSRRWRRLACAAVAATAAAAVANAPVDLAGSSARAMATSNMGAALAGQGRLEAAIELYRQALSLDADLPEAHLNLGSTLLVSGRAGEALPHLARAAELTPGDPAAELQLGAALVMTAQPDAARPHLERALELARAAGDRELEAQITPWLKRAATHDPG